MVPQPPQIAGPGDRLRGHLGDRVRVAGQRNRQTVLAKDVGEFILVPERGEIDLVGEGSEDLGVPAGQFGGPVVVEGKAALLVGGEPRLGGRLDGGVAGEDDPVLVDDDRAGGADLAQRLGDEVKVARVMAAGVVRIGRQGIEGHIGVRHGWDLSSFFRDKQKRPLVEHLCSAPAAHVSTTRLCAQYSSSA